MLVPGALTAPSMGLLAAGLVVALVDWVAVVRGVKRLEYLAKPATMVLLVGCALALRPVSGPQRTWFVVGLALGTVGDVFLMLPDDMFVPGLVAFLLGHLGFIAGFVATGFSPARAAAGAVIVAVPVALVLPRVLGGVATRRDSRLSVAVVAYVVVISLMVVTALASRLPLAAAPAALFMASDTIIAYRRFVSPRPWMPVTIMVTYHLAQAGLVLSLATA